MLQKMHLSLRLKWWLFVMNDKKTSVRRCCTDARSHGRGPGEWSRVWIVFPVQTDMWSMKDCDSVSARSWKQTHTTCLRSPSERTDAAASCLLLCGRPIPTALQHRDLLPEHRQMLESCPKQKRTITQSRASAAPTQLDESLLQSGLTPAASPTERMLFQKTWVKRELVVPCVCLSNMLLDWLSPRMAVTERFVHVGIRAGYRCWIIYLKFQQKNKTGKLPFAEGWRRFVSLRKVWGMTRRPFNAAQ